MLWADRYAWANWLLYEDTEDWPYFTRAGIPSMAAITNLSIEPDANGAQWAGASLAIDGAASYLYAIITITYQSAGYDLGDLLIEELTPRLKEHYLTGLYFSDGTKASAATKVLPEYTYSRTYPRLTYPRPWDFATGMCNLDAFSMMLIPRYIIPTCGLAAGGSINPSLHYDGTVRISQTNHCLIRGASWQMEWSKNGWDYLYDANNNQVNIYPYTIFSGLF